MVLILLGTRDTNLSRTLHVSLQNLTASLGVRYAFIFIFIFTFIVISWTRVVSHYLSAIRQVLTSAAFSFVPCARSKLFREEILFERDTMTRPVYIN